MLFLGFIFYFIACHGGPADHFSAFCEQLRKDCHEVHVYASGPAIKKFEENKIEIDKAFDADTGSLELACQIAQSCQKDSVVITDIGHPFDITLQKALATQGTRVAHLSYYDNPEVYVPGGYSKIGAEVLLLSDKVLFANANLVDEAIYSERDREIPLDKQKRCAIGYYPLHHAEKIASLRKECQKNMRAQWFSDHDLIDKGQTLLVYFGGNNQEYTDHAFPTFLNFLSEAIEQRDLSSIIIVLQQHPGAKAKNVDRKQFEHWMATHNHPFAPKMIVSSVSSDQMQIIACGILYYQTSMGSLFVLSDIPLLQVAHKPYLDILVRNNICASVNNANDFADNMLTLKTGSVSEISRSTIIHSLGIRKDWFNRLKSCVVLGE